MSTTFIAVQCYQCSTMQVKQQKKSSNRWSCVICNEKQSVRKVFAGGHLARDVRKFVQTFNLSRQDRPSPEQSQLAYESPPPTSSYGSFQNEKKRSDWTDYLNCDEEDGFKDEEEGEGFGFESGIKIVTELPTEMKKRLLKPVFKKRKERDNHDTDNKYPKKMTKQASKWTNYLETGHGEIFERERETHDSNKCPKKIAKQMSKWSNYLEGENDEMFEREARSGNPYTSRGGRDVLQRQFTDERVEDDIHPDFM